MIRLRVSGDRDRAVQLVRNLERSKRFLSPRLTGEATQAKEAGSQANNANVNPLAPAGVEFEILANYNPLPEGESYASEKKGKAEAADGGAKAGSGSGGQQGGAKRSAVKKQSAKKPAVKKPVAKVPGRVGAR